ncbi:hypothetical protein BU14_0266s0001 [Porphyra umbilicalis]|uniref:SHSP domain-containing protein n=1 Tax=Porphyra umbilicalis TaxID=2786 RepID=A0A1X6P246_PORUM|nr:hypothetical protein BU14_0266s0001 [Porphyra umbilicalis]|eukprot:OSX74810.1 hypothetical protein BU14_0266s0001 [Porphyra umbilicalis]
MNEPPSAYPTTRLPDVAAISYFSNLLLNPPHFLFSSTPPYHGGNVTLRHPLHHGVCLSSGRHRLCPCRRRRAAADDHPPPARPNGVDPLSGPHVWRRRPPPPPTDAQREAWRRQVAAFGAAAASAASSPDVQAALTKMGQAAAAAAGSPAVQSAMADMANEFLRNAEGEVDGGGGTPWARPPPPETTRVRPPTSSQPATPPPPPSPSPSRSPQPQPPSPPAGASTAPWPAWGVPTPAGRVDWVPRAELAETPTAYTWRVELPGVAKADVRTELRAADREVRVAGVKRRPGGDGGGGGGWPRGEVAYGSFGRSLALPADADVADRSSMRAAVRDGVLTVSVAKVVAEAVAADEAGVDIPVV